MKAVLLVLALFGCRVAEPAAPSRHVPDMISHTLLLKDPGCSSVRIGGGLVVTARHCVEDAYVINDLYTGLRVAYISADYDFAILDGDSLVDPVWLADAVTGEHVFVVGFPGSIDDSKQYLTVTDGIYTGVEYGGMQRLTAYAYYGNSGGGAWNDAGALVGILVEIRPAGDGEYGPLPMPAHSYIVPIRYVKAALE